MVLSGVTQLVSSIQVIHMVNIPLARSDYSRQVAKEARIRLQNRYFEQNPVLTENQSALIARPGLKRFLSVGDGPIRRVYSQPGSFNDAAFIASGTTLYRVDKDETITSIGTIPGTSALGAVSMAATSNIGDTPEYLFVASNTLLMCYIENGYARGTITGTPANNDVVVLGTTYYKFTNSGVDVGTPLGTVGNPWLVALGGTAAISWVNFSGAITNEGVPGVEYSTALTANDVAQTVFYDSTSVTVRANDAGIGGDSIATTETGAAIAWSSATLIDGGDPQWFQVKVPDDLKVISVGYIASHVVVVPGPGQDVNGRFYWIKPGETSIDPLDFATAERAPDPITEVVIFGDQFWFPGTGTTEAWYFTGNPDTPVLRLQGVVFDHGAWQGTAIQVKDSMIIVDTEGAVYQIGQNGLKRISPPDIEEQIRNAIGYQAQQEA